MEAEPSQAHANPEKQAADIVIMLATWILPFVLAYLPVWRWLISSYTHTHTRPFTRVLFATTLATSVYALLLVVYEILGVLEPSVRRVTWKLALYVQVVLLLVVLPWSCVFTLMRDLGLQLRSARLLASAGVLLFLWLFWQAGSIFPIVRGGASDLLSLEGSVGRLGVLGVTTAAILSGYGAVSTPYNYMSVFLQRASLGAIRAKEKQVRAQLERVLLQQRLLLEAELRLMQARDAPPPQKPSVSTDMDSRAAFELAAAFREPAVTPVRAMALGGMPRTPSVGLTRASTADEARTHSLVAWAQRLPQDAARVVMRPRAPSDVKPANKGMFERVTDYFTLPRNSDPGTAALEQDARSLREAVETENALLQELYGDHHALVTIYAREQWTRTLVGRIVTFIGVAWSFVCILQLAVSMSSALLNLSLRRIQTKDTVTTMLEWLLWLLPLPDADLWVQPLSFALVGALAFSSVRGFLLNFSQAFTAVSTSVTSNMTILVLAQVMGAYIVSTLLMLRMKVPPQYRRGITDAVGDVRFDFFHRWSDAIFVVSAVASMILYMIISTTRSSRISEEHDHPSVPRTRSFSQGPSSSDNGQASPGMRTPARPTTNGAVRSSGKKVE